MKKTLLFLFLILGSNQLIIAQNGLEKADVEIYYISDTNDATMNSVGGVLPIGSVTYRVYVDMLPGYEFQAAYGVNTPGEEHELRMETTTLFFNNEDRGATFPTYTKPQAADNTVMLDSWVSVGAACVGNFGVTENNDDGAATVVNNDGVLLNANPLAGLPLTTQDGLLLGTPEQVTAVGIATQIAMLDAQNDGTNGPVFSTFDGSWASLNGSVGPNADTNRVLIAQITTDGVFQFELNIQIGTPTGGVQNYVAKNPVNNEIQLASLTYPDSTTGIFESNPSAPLLFLVYPNPATDRIIIKAITSKVSHSNVCNIYDAIGNLVYTNAVKEGNQNYLESIDVSSFAKGQYIIELISDGVISSRKIIKQ